MGDYDFMVWVLVVVGGLAAIVQTLLFFQRRRQPQRTSQSSSFREEDLEATHHPMDASWLVGFYIGNGGYESAGLDEFFSQCASFEVDPEKVFLALEHYGAASTVAILREAQATFQSYDYSDYQTYRAAMDAYGKRINASADYAFLNEVYETRGASLEAKNRKI